MVLLQLFLASCLELRLWASGVSTEGPSILIGLFTRVTRLSEAGSSLDCHPVQIREAHSAEDQPKECSTPRCFRCPPFWPHKANLRQTSSRNSLAESRMLHVSTPCIGPSTPPDPGCRSEHEQSHAMPCPCFGFLLPIIALFCAGTALSLVGATVGGPIILPEADPFQRVT